ncbi:MAG TPA: hypothetical protein VMJ94_00600 [Nitrososphaera sp.]|nr:hypothetical protein [Nitrososphaera sp.]
MSSADLTCPVCSKVLEGSEYSHAASQLEKSVLQKYRGQLKKDKQAHRKQVQVMAKKYHKEKKSLQKRFGEQAKRSKEGQKRELVQLKKNYQVQLEHIREFYGTQNAALQSELKTSYGGQLEGMKKNYEGLATGNQRQIETLQKYLEDKVVGELKDKVSQLEEDKMSAELRLSEMVQQLDERNAEVVSLKDRLHRVDYGAPEPEQVDASSEAPDLGDNQQELLRIVKEVAQQQELGELKELEEEDPEEEEKHGFWGSKAGKRFGLF